MHTIDLRTARDTLTFDGSTGRLVSLRSHGRPDVERIASSVDLPAVSLQYLDSEGGYRCLDSSCANAVTVSIEEAPDGHVVTVAFAGLGGHDFDVFLTVRAVGDDPFSRWECRVRNGAGLRIVDVQFPGVVVPARLDGAVLLPAGFGELYDSEKHAWLPVDEPIRWRLAPENGNSPHYPGRVFAQFVAMCGVGGLYLACDDTQGHVKLIGALRRDEGIRLGVAHLGDWPAEGERTLEYGVLLGSFDGDWYDVAETYRTWSLQQRWATPLAERTDVPQWLLESPPHITVRLQGYVDDGPAPPIEEFLPYEKIIPLLEGVSKEVGSPLVAVLMSWERGGPWVYPDCFPPVGGDESLTAFCHMARERGWHVGSFCNGTRWVTAHLFNGYDGANYYRTRQGERDVCRKPDGSEWAEVWDLNWRPSFITCMAAEGTRQTARDFVRRLIGWGMESIQFFDQNCNAATFPCFSPDHGHPPMPGRWMADAMESMIGLFRAEATAAGESEVIQSTENPCNELCLPLFQQCDVRVSPPTSGLPHFVPVYHYLYHECIIMHGMMGAGPEPHHLPIRNALNGVLGEIPGAVMIGDGTLLNRDTFNWADWEPKVGSNEESLAMIRAVTQMRRGPGRSFLVFGRMRRPAEVSGIDTMEWDWAGRHHAVPSVLHAAWESPQGELGVILANWTREARRVEVHHPRLTGRPVVHITAADATTSAPIDARAGTAEIVVPGLGCALVVAPAC